MESSEFDSQETAPSAPRLTLLWSQLSTAHLISVELPPLKHSLWQVSAKGAMWKMRAIKEKTHISHCISSRPPGCGLNRSIVQTRGGKKRLRVTSFYRLLPWVVLGWTGSLWRHPPCSVLHVYRNYSWMPGGMQCDLCWGHGGLQSYKRCPLGFTCSMCERLPVGS